MTVEETPDVTMNDAASASANAEEIQTQILTPLVQAAASKDFGVLESLLRRYPDVNQWMPLLIAQLLPTTTDTTQQEQALLVVGTLATFDPEKYLLFVAKHFAQRIAHILQHDEPLQISPTLLQVWMQQLTQTSQVAVHSLLVQALIQAMQRQGPPLARPALQALAEIWKHHWNLVTTESNHSSSIVAVRCAATFCECLVALGDVAWQHGHAVGATRLLEQMLHYTPDPLLQLSILDLLPEQFAVKTTSIPMQGETQAWFTSTAMIQPVLDMLADPLLAGAALQCASWMATLTNDHDGDDSTTEVRRRILQHVRNEMGVTSNEADRLALVQALVQLSVASPSTMLEQAILTDETVRCCWWDMTRLSSPKLQAAILSSVSQVLRALSSSATDDRRSQYSNIGLKLYAFLSKDNTTSANNTTDWLYTKYIKSPLPELRIATYAVWAAVAALANGPMILSTSHHFIQHVLEGPREITGEARVAKFDVLQTFWEHSKGFLADAIQTKIEALLKKGPHDIQTTQPWDVALE